MTGPLVSAIVPMFNRGTTALLAVESLRRQTLTDLEIIVVDDGSTDGSAAVVEALAEPRLRIERHTVNQGIPAARNTGLMAARGDYIAWLDSDDVARPQRLERQVAYLRAHPDIAMVGSFAGRMAADGRTKRGLRVMPTAHEDLAPSLLFRSPFQQSSICGRREVLQEFPYRAEFPVCEDLDVFIRLAKAHRIANVGEALVDRRMHPGQTVRLQSDQIRSRKRLLFTPLLRSLGIEPSAEEVERHVTIGNIKQAMVDRDLLDWSEAWLNRLIAANRRAGCYDQQGLALACAATWLALGRRAVAGPDRGHALVRLTASPLSRGLFGRHGRRFLAAAGPAMLAALL